MKRIAMNATIGMGLIVLVTGLAIGDDDWGDRGKRYWNKSRLDVSPVSNKVYADECSECHFAYQPGLLPASSWQRIMENLDNHFGENAELDSTTGELIRTYLVENSAEKSDYRRSRAIVASLGNRREAPMRITETPYFLREHDELPTALIRGNDKIVSMSHCEACHQQAISGSYNEDEINIPGIGRWDD